MSTSQEKKKDLSNEEKIDENENKKYLLFKENLKHAKVFSSCQMCCELQVKENK